MTDGGATAARAFEALGTALARRPALRPWLAAIPAPLAPPERVWDAIPAATATFWETAGSCWAGLGETVVLQGAGVERLREIAGAIEGVRAAGWVDDGGTSAGDLCFFGGAAFTPAAAADPPWEGFGDARFVLPRWTYRVVEGRAWLVLALWPDPGTTGDLAGELSAILAALLAPGEGWAEDEAGMELREEDESSWRLSVDAARAAIDAGRFDKVVLVRRTHVRLASGRPESALLRRLGDEGQGLFRFGFRLGGSAFVGASPELLVARSGRQVRAEALAASLPRPSDADLAAEQRLASRLLADGKQRLEHALVVGAVRRALGPVCRELVAPATPEVRVLRHLLHLSTPVVGELASDVPLLELAARLHPTPAVAGEPRAEALEFLARHERHARGWFSGPVGRVTAGGEGELAVALRSALVRGCEAFVYAGAGLVAGSQADAELAETRAKARTCLAALGVQA